MPDELLSRDVQRFMSFCLMCWILWAQQFVVLLLWLVSFPLMSELQQLVLSFAASLDSGRS